MNNSSQFMDKQIMNLSNYLTNNDFINLTNNNSQEDRHHLAGASDKKEEIFSGSVFQQVRPIGPSSPSSKIDCGNLSEPRDWNSADNKTNPSGSRTYCSFDSFEPGRVILEKDRSMVDPTLVSEIDRTMKKYADDLMHALDSVSARLTKLESRTRHLDNSVDELKLSVGTNQGSSDGRMRQLENILREVQNGVQFIRDKQEIMDAQQQTAKPQVSKVEQHADIKSTERVDSSQPVLSIGQQSDQQLPPVAQLPSAVSPRNAPPPPSQQNLPPQIQQPNQFSLNQVPSVPQRDPYFAPPPPPPPPGQTPENLGQQYQLPQTHQLQASFPPQPQQQYQPFHQPQYSRPPAPARPHTSLPAAIPPQLQPPLAHHPEESPYASSQSYPPTIHQTPHPPSAAPPHKLFYGAPPNMYEPPSSQPESGFSGTFGPASVSGEQYPYSSSSSQYGSSSPVKPQQLSSPAIRHGGGSGYPQLPTARILPHGLPTASGVSGGSGSAGSENRVPIDDVVDKVTNMGFPRDLVRATVRKLTENGQSVDLNVVLDKLMNDGEVQLPRGWIGR